MKYSRKQWLGVAMCLGFGVPGCIFSPSLGEGGGGTDPSMDMTQPTPDQSMPDMTMTPDLPPPPDMGGAPGEMGVDPPDLQATECAVSSDCTMDHAYCDSNGTCRACPLVSVESVCDSEMNHCGEVATGTPEGCGPVTENCGDCGSGFTCVRDDPASSEPGVCQLASDAPCRTEDALNDFCQGLGEHCSELQFSCETVQVEPYDCDPPSRSSETCTLRDFDVSHRDVDMPRRVAIGGRYAVVTYRSTDPPDLFIRNDNNHWSRLPGAAVPSLPNDSALNSILTTVLGQMVVDVDIERIGDAVDIGENDRFMAVTARINVTTVDANEPSEPFNIVIVFERPANSASWDYAGVIAPASLEEREGFARSIALHGSLLAVGSPHSNDERGAVILYDLNIRDNHSFDDVDRCVGTDDRRIGDLVEFGQISSNQNIVRRIYTTAFTEDEIPRYEFVRCRNPLDLTSFADDSIVEGGGLSGVSMSADKDSVLIKTPGGTTLYKFDMIGGFAREANYESIESDVPAKVLRRLGASGQHLVALGDDRSLLIAPFGHTKPPEDAFNSFNRYSPLSSANYDLDGFEIVALDINAEGEAIFVAQDGSRAGAFFVTVPVP